MKVELVAKTQGVGKYEGLTSEEIVASIARHGVIKKDNGRLVKYLMREKHFSPLDMIAFSFEVETSRAIGRQWLRHASIKPQEHCITGDSLITLVQGSGRISKVKISDLFKRYRNNQYWSMSSKHIRVYDEELKEFVNSEIKEVFNNGLNDVYEVVLSGGRKIKCTKNHKFFDKKSETFIRLSELNEGDFVAVNGIPVYQDLDWLIKSKKESIENGGGLKYIANKANCSTHTIRKWLKVHNISFTKKEVASYTQVWNKGLPKENQPCYNRLVSEDERLKLSKAVTQKSLKNIKPKTLGSDMDKDARKYSLRFKRYLGIKQDFKCAISGEQLESDYEVDHILPISTHPELAFSLENLQAVNKKYHIEKTTVERSLIKKTIHYKRIESITYMGVEETFDIEVNHKSHNYVANGILVHNSQRYSDRVKFENIELRLEHPTNRQSSTELVATIHNDLESGLPLGVHNRLERIPQEYLSRLERLLVEIQDVYKEGIRLGIAKECIRNILPECTTSTLTFNGTLRSWLSFLNVRCDHHAQKEIQELATMVGEILEKEMPNVFSQIDWRQGMFM